jgi:hypothetical protein
LWLGTEKWPLRVGLLFPFCFSSFSRVSPCQGGVGWRIRNCA